MILLLHTSVALGCTLSDPDSFRVEADPTDVDPPTPSIVTQVKVTRGHSGSCVGGGGGCDGLATLHITVQRPAADPDGDDDVGYAIIDVAGDPPGFDSVDDDARWLGPSLRLHWFESHPDYEAPLDFVLGLVVTDRAGNEGDMVEVEVNDPGRPPLVCEDPQTGCRTVPLTGSWAWLAGLLWVATRSRAGRSPPR